MPVPVLIALFLAFGFHASEEVSTRVLTPVDIAERVAEILGAIAFLGIFAFLFGRLIAWLVNRHDGVSTQLRRAHYLGVRLVDLLCLVAFGWMIHDLGYASMIHQAIGNPVLVDEVLIFLPFPIMQLLGWWGLHAAERAIRWRVARTPGRYVWLKARQSFGMILPVAAFYAAGSDLFRLLRPDDSANLWEKPLGLALMGGFVLLVSPLLVRIAWPTRPLPSGPLRDRLERLAGRAGFRCTDILVWDTNGTVINAGVTGSLPWFRYVLLTDALVECLPPPEVAAVFGHEIGHIAHRHLVSFGLFIVGSLGVYALTDAAITTMMLQIPRPPWLAAEGIPALILELAVALLVVGVYFLLVFGHLSRRFERQADVFGCRVVSCGQSDCPPHFDLDDDPSHEANHNHPSPSKTALCPIGIRIFVTALTNVAELNGMKPGAWSWRHGSIRRRIAFLESLTNQPEAERKFQTGVTRMRRGVALVLGLTLLLAFWTGLFR